MFGELPKVERDAWRHRGGPSLKWVREVIGLASRRLSGMNPKGAIVRQLAAGTGIKALLDMSTETLGRELEAALAAVRGRKT
jgi:hypothetical protein